MYVTNEGPSANCNKCHDFSISLKKNLANADLDGVCDILSAERKKRVLPFFPVQDVQKSALNLYVIWKKMHLLQSKRSVSPRCAQYSVLLQLKHVTLIFVSITSRVAGKCLRWCVWIQPVDWVRIPPINCIRNEMRIKCDTLLIAIKMNHIHRQERNRQIKRVTSNTPKSCGKTNSRFWCAQGEDRPARCIKEKNEW